MALLSCTECQKEVSDKALACPHCGFPLRGQAMPPAVRARHTMLVRVVAVALFICLAGAGVAVSLRPPKYSLVEQLRGEQDVDGTHTEKVRQRFYRLYTEHPRNAMYIYLWARCVDDPSKQLELAEQGIHADPRFSWNYNMAARALARLNRVPEAYDQAVKGAALDPGNLELANKKKSLKVIIDRKLVEQPKVAEGAGQHYAGLFGSWIRSPGSSDIQAIKKGRLPDYGNPVADAVRGFMVCANPYADSCLRVFVPRDGRLKRAWPSPATDVSTAREHDFVSITGSVLATSEGENILLADAVSVEPP